MKKFIVYLLLSSCVAAQRPGNERLWEGIYAFYSYEYEKSVTVLSEVKREHPDHPTVHFTWAVAKWLRAKGYNGIDASYHTLLTALDSIVPIYENYVERFPNEPQFSLYLAASKGLKARVHLGKKEWVSVVMEGIKGYGGLRTLYREHPEIHDIYFPMGILNYYAGNMSGFVRFLSTFVGIDADKELGLELMTVTAEKGEFAWIEASQILVYIYLWMGIDYGKALAISERLVEKLPESIYANKTPPLSRKGWLPTLKYQEALLAFYREDYDEALNLATQSIDEFSAELDTPLGYGYLLRGMIRDLRGERARAVADYRSAIRLDNYTSAVRDSRGYLRRPYTPSVR